MKNLDSASRHSAGATVVHISKFDNLLSHNNDFELSQTFIDKWIVPFYMRIGSMDTTWIDELEFIKNELNRDIVLTLLGDFNWRSRLVGAYFATIREYDDMIDMIGVHLLKSEVCCVGHIYAIIFAFYNNEKSNYYLKQYLDYYLLKPELYFDQEVILEAVLYLDKLNGTTHIKKYIPIWDKLQRDRIILSKKRNIEVAKYIEMEEGKEKAQILLNDLDKFINSTRILTEKDITDDYVCKQVDLLKEAKDYINI